MDDETDMPARTAFPRVFHHIGAVAKIRSPGKRQDVVIESARLNAIGVAAGLRDGSGNQQTTGYDGDEESHGALI